MQLTRADSRRAYAELKKVNQKIERAEMELSSLNLQRIVFEKYLCTLEGVCPECQNPHFPHCKTEEL